MTDAASYARPRHLAPALGALVAAVMALYYFVLFFPPRLAGASEPDRYHHIGLSKLIAAQGVIKTLPQVEDLGWGLYFLD